jgi:hypothetical protein
MLYTTQASYEKMRKKDVGSNESTITDFRPSARTSADISNAWYALDVLANGAEIVPYQADNTAGKNGTWELWGMATGNGMAQHIAKISGTVGTAKISDDFTALAYDTLNVILDTHPTTVRISDGTGSNRPARIDLDTVGFKYLKIIYTDITADNNAFIRPF